MKDEMKTVDKTVETEILELKSKVYDLIRDQEILALRHSQIQEEKQKISVRIKELEALSNSRTV